VLYCMEHLIYFLGYFSIGKKVVLNYLKLPEMSDVEPKLSQRKNRLFFDRLMNIFHEKI